MSSKITSPPIYCYPFSHFQKKRKQPFSCEFADVLPLSPHFFEILFVQWLETCAKKCRHSEKMNYLLETCNYTITPQHIAKLIRFIFANWLYFLRMCLTNSFSMFHFLGVRVLIIAMNISHISLKYIIRDHNPSKLFSHQIFHQPNLGMFFFRLLCIKISRSLESLKVGFSNFFRVSSTVSIFELRSNDKFRWIAKSVDNVRIFEEKSFFAKPIFTFSRLPKAKLGIFQRRLLRLIVPNPSQVMRKVKFDQMLSDTNLLSISV